MTPMTMVFGREKSFRLGESSFPIHEDFSLGLKNRTKYVYGTTLSDSDVASGDLLRAVIYPGSSNSYTMNGTVPTFTNGASGYDRVEYRYDRQGEQIEAKDQNGTVHDYVFDQLGRETEDEVTAFGSNIDQTVDRIQQNYDLLGNLDNVSSFGPNPSSSSTVYSFSDSGNVLAPASSAGYIMYSQESISTRFDLTGANGHFIAVQFDDGWQYYDGAEWTAFTPRATDFLAASFASSGAITLYDNYDNYNSLQINGISAGYTSGTDTSFGFGPLTGGDFSVSGSYVAPASVVVNEVFRQYNDWGMLTEEYQSVAGPVDTSSTPAVGYGYDNTANPTRLTSMTYPNGRILDYVYNSGADDALGRVSSIVDGGTTDLADYTYLGLDQVAAETYEQPDVNLGISLDPYGRVQTQNWTSNGSDGPTIDGYVYTYDPAGNVLSKKNMVTSGSSTLPPLDEYYTYNDLNELTGMARGTLDNNGTIPSPVTTQNWTLDAAGNMTDNNGTQETFNTANQEVQSINSVTPAYDNAGNMTTMPSPNSGSTALTCKYDAWNRLVSVTGGGASVTYSYDGLGRKVVEVNGANTTYSYYNGQNVIETRLNGTEAANLQYQYVWSLRGVKTPLLRDDAASSVRLYYLTDANDNVTAVVGLSDGTWSVQEHYVYSPYGAVTCYVQNSPTSWFQPTTTSAVGNTLLFASMDLDTTTGLYYDEARWYSTSLCTFITTDPIGYRGGINLYEYVGDDPLTRVDLTGRSIADPNDGLTNVSGACCSQPVSTPQYDPSKDKCAGKWIDVPIRLGYVKGASMWLNWNGMLKDLKDANEIWSQCCIHFHLVNDRPIIVDKNIGPNGNLVIDPNVGAVSEDPFPVKNPTSINVFYVGGFINYNNGELANNVLGVSQLNSNNEYLIYTWTQYHVLAHEIGHTLLGAGHPDQDWDTPRDDPYTNRLMCKNASWQTDTTLTDEDCEKARQKAEELNKTFENNAVLAK